jgi:oligopeptide transport system substrate-binding protein
MNVNKPPFNNVLVRKAFSAAVDKQGLINAKLGGVQRPALTFIPPGVLGYVDGQTQGVGIPYDVAQARQWLAQAGYPNGRGLPPVTLWINTNAGHQAIAQYIQQNWYTNLGVNVTLQNEAWSSYMSDVRNGQFQIWRWGWCMDYPYANYFLAAGSP